MVLNQNMAVVQNFDTMEMSDSAVTDSVDNFSEIYLISVNTLLTSIH